MQGSERGCAADRERSSVAGSSGSVKRRSRRRWSAEQKVRIVGDPALLSSSFTSIALH